MLPLPHRLIAWGRVGARIRLGCLRLLILALAFLNVIQIYLDWTVFLGGHWFLV